MNNSKVPQLTEKEKQSLCQYATHIACEVARQEKLGYWENCQYYRNELAGLLSQHEFLSKHLKSIKQQRSEDQKLQFFFNENLH